VLRVYVCVQQPAAAGDAWYARGHDRGAGHPALRLGRSVQLSVVTLVSLLHKLVIQGR
jgi:hypothetical protein